MTIPRSDGRTCADLATRWLRRRLGRAVALAYLAAVLLPGPGGWLRHPHTPRPQRPPGPPCPASS
ncbi:hypothetical protein [Streptomyces sp. MZ04]|uniref:hypothetical protein n=1 Tax=Streptomyces sp. MZ04 TaxID=2559236 RepID=UPI0032B00A65